MRLHITDLPEPYPRTTLSSSRSDDASHVWFQALGGRRCPRELPNHGLRKSRNVIRITAGDQIAVNDDFLINPLGSGILQVSLHRCVRREPMTSNDLGFNQDLRCVADGGHRFPTLKKLSDELDSGSVKAELVRIEDASGKHQGIVLIDGRGVDGAVDFDVVAPIRKVPAADAAFFRCHHLRRGAGIFKRFPRLGQFDLFESVRREDCHADIFKWISHGASILKFFVTCGWRCAVACWNPGLRHHVAASRPRICVITWLESWWCASRSTRPEARRIAICRSRQADVSRTPRTMGSLPFSVEVYSGFGRMDGRMRIETTDEGRFIRLDYQVKDDIFGVLKSRPRQVRVSFADIESIRFVRRRFMTSYVELVISNLSLAERIPGSEMGRLNLRVKRNDRDRAQRTVELLQRMMTEHRLLDDDRPLTEEEIDLLFDDLDTD